MDKQSPPKQKTFGFQNTLPRLPIPTLQETAKAYLEGVKPLLSENEYVLTQKRMKSFIQPGGLGETLQKRLLCHDKSQPASWLERWWYQRAYHSWREPLVVNVNWVAVLSDHPHHPNLQPSRGEFTAFQIRRAAGLITLALNYKEALEKETLPAENARGTPLCMNQFRYLFGTTRIPLPECDTIVGDLSTVTNTHHIVVLIKDQFYKVDVIHTETKQRFTIDDIERQLDWIIKDVLSSTRQPPVGHLTGAHRDLWAKAREHMIKISRKNREALSIIDESLLVIALDDYSDHIQRQVFHGINGFNRWFDKAVTLVIANNGKVGLSGEHSPSDALTPSGFGAWMVSREPASDPQNAIHSSYIPKKLEFEIDYHLQENIIASEKTMKDLTDDCDMDVYTFDKFGADWVKNKAKISPDSYVQLALQLTFFRLHQTITAVYETAGTRRFLHGRTENCRSLSTESAEFIRNFDCEKVSNNKRWELFRKAASKHQKTLQQASLGKGVDRHLMGLYLCLQKDESHELFTDPSYTRSTTFRLSTSSLGPGKNMVATGFGASTVDGYGINYMSSNHYYRFGIESKRSCKETSTERFILALEKSLDDLKDLVDRNIIMEGTPKL